MKKHPVYLNTAILFASLGKNEIVNSLLCKLSHDSESRVHHALIICQWSWQFGERRQLGESVPAQPSLTIKLSLTIACIRWGPTAKRPQLALNKKEIISALIEKSSLHHPGWSKQCSIEIFTYESIMSLTVWSWMDLITNQWDWQTQRGQPGMLS